MLVWLFWVVVYILLCCFTDKFIKGGALLLVMGTCYVLIDYDRRRMVDLDKCFPGCIFESDVNDELGDVQYVAFWFSQIAFSLYDRSKPGKFLIVGDYSSEFERCRWEEKFDFGYYSKGDECWHSYDEEVD